MPRDPMCEIMVMAARFTASTNLGITPANIHSTPLHGAELVYLPHPGGREDSCLLQCFRRIRRSVLVVLRLHQQRQRQPTAQSNARGRPRCVWFHKVLWFTRTLSTAPARFATIHTHWSATFTTLWPPATGMDSVLDPREDAVHVTATLR